jgi:hypothetical protein
LPGIAWKCCGRATWAADSSPHFCVKTYIYDGMATTALDVACQSTAKGPAMKNLDEMTLDELRALETERYQKYADQYDHAGPDAAIRVRYFEVVAVIYNKLRRELDRGLVAYAALGRMDESEQTNGVHAHADLHGVAVPS